MNGYGPGAPGTDTVSRLPGARACPSGVKVQPATAFHIERKACHAGEKTLAPRYPVLSGKIGSREGNLAPCLFSTALTWISECPRYQLRLLESHPYHKSRCSPDCAPKPRLAFPSLASGIFSRAEPLRLDPPRLLYGLSPGTGIGRRKVHSNTGSLSKMSP